VSPPEFKDTHIGRAAREVDAWQWAWRRHRLLVALAALAILGGYVYCVKKITGLNSENAELRQRLAPFEAIAAKSFPNQQDRERMDSLIQSIQELSTKYGSFALRRSDEIELKKKAAEFCTQFRVKNTNSPAITIHVYYAASDASRRFADQLRSILRDCQWDVAVEAGETMIWTLDRGLWIGRYSDIQKNPETFLFCVNIFTSLGLDLKLLKLTIKPPGDSRLHLIIHDPKYIR